MNIDNIMKHSNATPFITKTSTGVVCIYCIKTFELFKDLKTHIKDTHKDEIVTNFMKVESDRLCFKVDITDLECKICNKRFDVISSLKSHLIKDHNIIFHHDVNDYFCEFKLESEEDNSCAFCNETFNSFLMLLQHMNAHYSNYTCKVCKVGFINIQALKSHERNKCLANPDNKNNTNELPTKSVRNKRNSRSWSKLHSNTKNILKYSNCTPFANQTVAGIACAFCDSYLGNIQELKAHVIDVHYKKDNYIIHDIKKKKSPEDYAVKFDITDLGCNICNTNFAYISDLVEHLTKDHAFVFYTDVKVHFAEFKLTSNGIFTCVFCNSNYETFKSLLQHLNKHYNNYVCEVCGASFLTKNSQRLHTKVHLETGPHKCSTCSKLFSNKRTMLIHQKVVHQKQPRFKTKCPFCDAKFTDYLQRNQHLLDKHDTKAANYNCNCCDKTFILKKQLTRHVKRIHLMERNHSCSYCDYKFFSPAELKDHLITHEREKSKTHRCEICSKSFTRPKTLKAHMIMHIHDKKFKCGICCSEFRHKVSLKNHMSSKHQKVEYQSFEMVDDDESKNYIGT